MVRTKNVCALYLEVNTAAFRGTKYSEYLPCRMIAANWTELVPSPSFQKKLQNQILPKNVRSTPE